MYERIGHFRKRGLLKPVQKIINAANCVLTHRSVDSEPSRLITSGKLYTMARDGIASSYRRVTTAVRSRIFWQAHSFAHGNARAGMQLCKSKNLASTIGIVKD